MCQAEVYKIVEKNKGKWITTSEIAKGTTILSNTVSGNLRKLYHQGLVSRKVRSRSQGGYLWKYLK